MEARTRGTGTAPRLHSRTRHRNRTDVALADDVALAEARREPHRPQDGGNDVGTRTAPRLRTAPTLRLRSLRRLAELLTAAHGRVPHGANRTDVTVADVFRAGREAQRRCARRARIACCITAFARTLRSRRCYGRGRRYGRGRVPHRLRSASTVRWGARHRRCARRRPNPRPRERSRMRLSSGRRSGGERRSDHLFHGNACEPS